MTTNKHQSVYELDDMLKRLADRCDGDMDKYCAEVHELVDQFRVFAHRHCPPYTGQRTGTFGPGLHRNTLDVALIPTRDRPVVTRPKG